MMIWIMESTIQFHTQVEQSRIYEIINEFYYLVYFKIYTNLGTISISSGEASARS